MAEVAARTGVPRTTVFRKIQELNLCGPKPDLPPVFVQGEVNGSRQKVTAAVYNWWVLLIEGGYLL